MLYYIYMLYFIILYHIILYHMLYFIISYYITWHYTIYNVYLYIYIYVYLVKRVKVGWQFFRGLATLDAAPLRWTKSGWQRWTFWRTPRPQALWQMGQNQQERPKKSIKQILFDKAPMCVDECIPSIICKMTPGPLISRYIDFTISWRRFFTVELVQIGQKENQPLPMVDTLWS